MCAPSGPWVRPSFVPPLNTKQEVRGGGSCMLEVDSRAWEGKSNPFKKRLLPKIFSSKIFLPKIFFKKIFSQIFFWTKYCCQKYFRKKYFQQKYFSEKNHKNIFKKKYFCQIFFQKKRWGQSPLAARRA